MVFVAYHAGFLVFGMALGMAVGYFQRIRLEKRLNRRIRKEVLMEFERRAIPSRIYGGGRFAT